MAEITTLAEAVAELVVNGTVESRPGDHEPVLLSVRAAVTVVGR